jgi:protein O-GlcNAc transferase
VIAEEISEQFNLGNNLLLQGRPDQAIDCFRRVLELQPDHADAHNNLGNAFLNRGELDAALASYQRAVEVNPEFAAAYYNLGTAFQKAGSLDVAMACHRKALTIQPEFWEAHSALGAALAKEGKFDEAIEAYHRAIEIAPHAATPHNNLGASLREMGRLDEALAEFWRAVELNPEYVAADSNFVYLLGFHPDIDAAANNEEHRRWNERRGVPLAASIRPHENDRGPDRRLRIGYVSPEFRHHCQSFFTVPLFSHHNHAQFESFCYSDVIKADSMTPIIASFADHWRNIAGLADEHVAEIIRQDQIDILVDLTMHMSSSRPLLFARKPAPVQVCWLAYPGTTGLTAIDYRLTDPYLDPPGVGDQYYSEQSIRLPDTFWCYCPSAATPDVNELPSLASGSITFGSLNNFSKVNDLVLLLWSRVLHAVAGSRLAILAPEGSCRDRTLTTLAQHGIDAERIRFFSRQPMQLYFSLYHQIDIGLDTFPANGHTTSLDSYWMGVPVVTIVGKTVLGRAGLSQLTNLGLSELIAHNPDQFVAIAASLASDIPRLTHLRHTLRQRMITSPLMDAPRFARNMEATYRQMWQNWCASGDRNEKNAT